LLRKLREKVFVNTVEHVAGRDAQTLGSNIRSIAFEKVVFEAFVVFRQLAGDGREAAPTVSIAPVKAAPSLPSFGSGIRPANLLFSIPAKSRGRRFV
jgi:hypothetical protein